MPSLHAGARTSEVALDAALLILCAGATIGGTLLVEWLVADAGPAFTLLLGGLGSGVSFIVAVVCYVRWTLVGDGIAIRLALAFVTYGMAVAPLVARRSDGPVGAVLQTLGTVLVTGMLLLAARAPDVDGGYPVVRTELGVTAGLVTALVVVATVPGAAARIAGARVGQGSVLALAGPLVIAAAVGLAVAGLRRTRRALTASGVGLLGLATAPVAMTIDTPTESSAMLAGATQLAGLLVVAHATVVDARYALSTASRHDLDLRLRWQQAAARADEVVRVEHERNHEIRSGLLAVEGAGKLLSQRLDGGGDGAAASLADAVQREVSRLQRIAAPIEDDPPTSYGLLDVLEPLVVAHRATGQRIRLDVPPDLDAEGRPHVLAEVMSNLLVNSARHAPDARVTITGSPGSRPGFTRVVVADDGPGFPAGGLVHALERGWRGFGSSALGSGLGLYLSSHLMELEGGALKLQPPALGTHGAVVALEVRAGRGPSVQAALDVLADAS